MQTVYCFKCETPLDKQFEDVIYDGGYATLEFGYGSKYDQIYLGRGKKLTECELKIYICDSCFNTTTHLVEGYSNGKLHYKGKHKVTDEFDYLVQQWEDNVKRIQQENLELFKSLFNK